MEASELYYRILGIELPWTISTISVDEKTQQVNVWLCHAPKSKFACAQCGAACSVHDHQPERQWRHLDTCQYMTILRASVPRVKCGSCGVVTASIPWAQPYSRFSEMFECYAIDILQSCQVIERSADLLRISPDQLHYLMQKSVERGLALRQSVCMPITSLAIDEKSLQTGHHYVTILSDATENRVLEVTAERTLEAVKATYNALSDKQLETVKSVTMDMWSPFATVTQQVIPHADIVHDRFHLSCYLNNAVDITRRAENKKLVAHEDKSLQKTKYLWLKNPENFTEKEQRLFDQLRSENIAPQLFKAYDLKEEFRTFFECATVEQATKLFEEWQDKVVKSKNTHLIKVATMFQNHFEGIKNYIKHRVTNAIAEGLNSRIQQLKAKARGFKSPKAFRIAILFHFGKLALYPT